LGSNIKVSGGMLVPAAELSMSFWSMPKVKLKHFLSTPIVLPLLHLLFSSPLHFSNTPRDRYVTGSVNFFTFKYDDLYAVHQSEKDLYSFTCGKQPSNLLI
jgi:hypothetical protein